MESNWMLNATYAAISNDRTDQGARVEPLLLDLEPAKGSLCNISRLSTGHYQRALRNEIETAVGTVQLPGGEKVYNFSFDVFHLYTTKMQKFATWTADRGFMQVAGAYEKHLEHFDQYLKKVNLTVVSVEDPPFSIYREEDPDGQPLVGNDRWTGFAVELFKEIARRMQLRYTLRKSIDGKFGSPVDGTDNREWSGMIGELIRGTAHVAVASFTITYDREKVVDFTTPYMSLGLSVIMKKSKQDPDLFQFLLPFSNRVWLYMVLAWLLTAIIMYACARVSPYEWYAPSACDPVVQNQFTALNSLWFTIGSLMQQGSDLAPRATSTRMVGAVWWFFTLILISSYTANLAAFLTVTRLNDISSIGDLAGQTNIKYGTLMGGSTYNFFKNSEIAVYKTMWESMSGWAKTNDSFMMKTADGIERVRRGGYAYILESTFNTYYRERDCSLMQVGNIFNPMSYAFGVNHGNVVLRDRLTEEILKLQKEQFIEGLTETWLKRFNVSKPCSDQARNAQETGTLDVDAVGGVFVSLLIGLAIAAGICIVELIVRAAISSRKSKMSFQEIALNQVKLAVSCSGTNPSVNGGNLQPSPIMAVVRDLPAAQLHESSPCLLRRDPTLTFAAEAVSASATGKTEN